MSKLKSMQRVSLKDNSEINEKVIQEYIYSDPTVLGLGDLSAINKEKVLPQGGRLDLLLQDDSNTRYELELQLGSTDPSHIIRTIEYWDSERKRYPQYDHCAIIVAEEITGRFQNVISLFNGVIPIIAMQVAAYKTETGDIALIFTKIMDRLTYALDDEDESEPTDRAYWQKRASAKTLKIMDDIYEGLGEEKQGFILKYNKYYVGLAKDGIAKNFVSFKPKKSYVWVDIKCDKSQETEDLLQRTDLEYTYANAWSYYEIKINSIEEFKKNDETLNKLIGLAKDRANID